MTVHGDLLADVPIGDLLKVQAEMRQMWFCECVRPTTDGLGECSRCRRKPRELMAVG